MMWAAACGMTEGDFWDCTPRFMAASIKALEEDHRRGWEMSRYVAFHAIKPGDHKNRLKKLTDLGRFPWEYRPAPKFTPEDIKSMGEFSDEADEILKKTNPAAYEAYMAGKKQTQNAKGDS